MRIPTEYLYAWYILRYHENFNGMLSDERCSKKIAYETGGVNLVEYVRMKNELIRMSENDISILKEILEEYVLYFF